MSGITLQQAQANLAALQAAQAAFNGRKRISIQTTAGRREVEYISLKELTDAIRFWSRQVAQLNRVAAGKNRHGYALGNFSGNR